MSMNLIAILVSLAMMLTGVGGAVQTDATQPVAETARKLTLSNVNVTWNGKPLRLDPQAHIGVSTDGTRALYDFGVEVGDKKLMPVQLSVGEKGLTALSVNSGIAVNVTAEALEGLTALLEEQMNASMAEAGDDDAQMMKVLTEEYMPAYVDMLKLAMDPAQRARINDTAQAVFDRVVDRGEGKPTVLEVDGVKYDVTAYSYSLDAMQMAALTDAEYGEIPELNAFYSALFKLYGMLPEESGLRGLDSFTALFERFGVQMQLDVEEQRTDDGAVDQMDSVLTMDLSSMMNVPQGLPTAEDALSGEQPEAEPAEAQPEVVNEGEDQMAGAPLEAEAEAETEAETGDEAANAAPEAAEAGETEVAQTAEAGEAEASDIVPEVVDVTSMPVLPPIVMKLHSLKLPEYSQSNGSCTYALDEHYSVDITMTASESEGVQELEAKAIMSKDGKKRGGGKLSAFIAQDETGASSYSMSMKAIKQNRARVDAAIYGTENPDGTSENSVAVELSTRNKNVEVSFDLDVTADAIADATAGVEPACVIGDLSQEGIQALGQDPAVMGTLMQMLGSMIVDVNTLKADPGLKTLRRLMRGKGMPIDVDELDEPDEADFDVELDYDGANEGEEADYSIVIGEDGDYELVASDGNETGFDFGEEPVEDDGVLAFAQPRLMWLPSGWNVTDVEVDTAYDWVQMTVTDASGAECAYAIFFLDPEAGTANYIVQDSGEVLDGRMMNVTDFGEGGLSVTVSENGMYGNLMFNSEAIELDTIGNIVAGIEF